MIEVRQAGFSITRSLVRFLLERAANYKWSIQGFGMLRLYLDGDHEPRLNIWDSRYRIPNVSMMHTHPWDFASLVVAGELTNIRYVEAAPSEQHRIIEVHSSQIKPGPGGGLRRHAGEVLEEREVCRFMAQREEVYCPGDVYFQLADEIHVSLPSDGCITINLRERVGADVARTFWPRGTDWVSAEPRVATAEEVADITQLALRGL